MECPLCTDRKNHDQLRTRFVFKQEKCMQVQVGWAHVSVRLSVLRPHAILVADAL